MSSPHYPKCTDWSNSTGKLNISVFVFRDTGRNGVYDVQDRPLAAIAVEMRDEAGESLIVRSNIAGFANFQMSTSEGASAIRSPGKFIFEVVPPPGWAVTTGNQVQDAEFILAPGSVSGLACVEPPSLVGLAPHSVLRGQVDSGTLSNPLEDFRILKGGSVWDQVPIKHPYATIERRLEPGDYDLQLGQTQRPVKVGAYPVDFGTLAPEFSVAQDEAERPWQEIDFETAVLAAIGKVPSGYSGLKWHNFVAVDNAFYQGEGYINGTVSGRHVVYNGSGHPTEILHEKGFDLLGCHLCLAWIRSEGETLVVEAYKGDVLVALDRLELSALGPIWYEPRFAGVTRVRFATEHYWQFVMDGLWIRHLP
ncbi:MAG: hypothetical protein ACAI34_25370 [Verrucomicrobium sp.]